MATHSRPTKEWPYVEQLIDNHLSVTSYTDQTGLTFRVWVRLLNDVHKKVGHFVQVGHPTCVEFGGGPVRQGQVWVAVTHRFYHHLPANCVFRMAHCPPQSIRIFGPHTLHQHQHPQHQHHTTTTHRYTRPVTSAARQDISGTDGLSR